VAIKVDREERPDVDAVYMAATQAMTGQGGWPMTVFMTPAGEPFYTGTYFPRDYFQRLVLGVAQAWREDRGGVHGQAARVAALLAEHAAPWRGSPPVPDLAAVGDQAVTTLASEYDPARGGRRSSRRRWCWNSCSAIPSGPAAPGTKAGRRWPW